MRGADRMRLMGVGVEGMRIRMGGVRGVEGRGRTVVMELGARALIGGGWGLDLGGDCYGVIMMIRSKQMHLDKKWCSVLRLMPN